MLSFFVVAQKKDTLSLLLANVSKKSLQKNIYFLAGDSCQGRMAATHGDSVATIFVERWMKQSDLQPGASKNSFRQDVPLIDYVTNPDEIDIDGESEKKFDSWFYFGFQKSLEKELIIKALKKHRGKRRDASSDLGISERTLYRKLKEYSINE